MQSLLVKCWAELLWQNESLQLAGLCCVHLRTAGLGGVESSVWVKGGTLVYVQTQMEKVFSFYQWEEWNTSMEVRVCVTHAKVAHQLDRFCHISFVSVQCNNVWPAHSFFFHVQKSDSARHVLEQYKDFEVRLFGTFWS